MKNVILEMSLAYKPSGPIPGYNSKMKYAGHRSEKINLLVIELFKCQAIFKV